MPWIARDKQGKNPYRLFGTKPVLLQMVSYDGERVDRWTWSFAEFDSYYKRLSDTYNPLSNDENTEILEVDSPIHLEPGEGPIEVKLTLINNPARRPFEGAHI